MPWARAVQKSLEGNFEGASYGYYSTQRDQDFIHSEILGVEQVYLFGLKNKVPKSWNTLDELLELRVGVTRGYGYTDEAWTFFRKGKHGLSVVNSDLQNMQMILLGRIDLFPMEELTAWHILDAEFSKEDKKRVQMLRPVFQTLQGHFIVPRRLQGARVLMDMFNRGLGKLKENGKFAEYKRNLKSGYYSERIRQPQRKNS